MTSTAIALRQASFPTPASLGSLDNYIQAVNRYPILAPEQETELGRRLRDSGDIEAARQLVLSHLRVVVAIARGYLGYGLPHADLIQEGNIGLMKAVKRFDPERGVRLVSFAIHWIKAEIHEYILRNWRLVRIATTKAQRKLFFNLRSMKKGLESLSPDEIQAVATELRVKPEEVAEMEMRLAGQDIALEPSSDDEEEAYAPIAYLSDPDNEPSKELEEGQMERVRAEGLGRALAQLDPRSRRIIERRWLVEKDAATLHELAAEFSVSAERIRQIEAKALQKMRGVIGAH
jgi:RNA polymerase sigma-32 factor